MQAGHIQVIIPIYSSATSWFYFYYYCSIFYITYSSTSSLTSQPSTKIKQSSYLKNTSREGQSIFPLFCWKISINFRVNVGRSKYNGILVICRILYHWEEEGGELGIKAVSFLVLMKWSSYLKIRNRSTVDLTCSGSVMTFGGSLKRIDAAISDIFWRRDE